MTRPSRPVQVLIVGSVLFTFISYWRTAAIVLCDLGSTCYYIGGIVEQFIGKAAPWFILAVMLFSFAVNRVYLESCSLFVRGGVYRVVKEAMGGFLGKLAVSALMFDYILTGPISSVSAGQYIMGLLLEMLRLMNPDWAIGDQELRTQIRNFGAVVIAIGIVLYFFRRNLLGLHESSATALKIMIITGVMGAIMIAWCLLTLALRDPAQVNWHIPTAPDLRPRVELKVVQGKDPITGEVMDMYQKGPDGKLVPLLGPDGKPEPKLSPITGEPEDPLGFLGRWFPGTAQAIRETTNWLTLIGFIGIMIAFGHSLLAMSGMETMAQVYREVESPKMPNFKKAAWIIFLFSLTLTGSISFLAVMIIPDEVRMKYYADNLIGGLAMHVVGPDWLRLLLNAFVVIVGFLLLSGAVNTSIIGSNGVLNRVAEDGVIPAWLQKPHKKYGTTFRLLYLIVGLQIVTILASRGDVLLLGEAYAFGVIWSFTFKTMSMVVLRFTDKTPREARVPLNLKFGSFELPLGLILIFLILLTTALLNLLTKEVATVSGLAFTAVFLGIFMSTEYLHERQRRLRGEDHEHVEQFNKQTTDVISPEAFQLEKPYRKLVAIRSPQNLHMLERALEETDPETTDIVVMTAKVSPPGSSEAKPTADDFDPYDRQLMTAVLEKAERAGKEVLPLILPTNNPIFAIISTARDLRAQELVMGASNKYTAEEQLDQVAFYWMNLTSGLPEPPPITIRILGRNWDTHIDLFGGNRIPTLRERKAKNVADLRAAGIGVKRVLFYHDGSGDMEELYDAVLTLVDEAIPLGLAYLEKPKDKPEEDPLADLKRAAELNRPIEPFQVKSGSLDELLDLAKAEHFDLLIYPRPSNESPERFRDRLKDLQADAACRVFIAYPPVIPREVEEDPPTIESPTESARLRRAGERNGG